MTRNRSVPFFAGAVAVPLAALAVAGCGGGSGGSTGASAAASHPKTTSGSAATVGAANEGNLGKILIDSYRLTS